MLGCEVRVLPVGELLCLADFLAKDNSKDLLQAQFHDAIFAYYGLQVNTIGWFEVTSPAKTIDIIFECQSYFAYVWIGEYFRDFNG